MLCARLYLLCCVFNLDVFFVVRTINNIIMLDVFGIIKHGINYSFIKIFQFPLLLYSCMRDMSRELRARFRLYIGCTP